MFYLGVGGGLLLGEGGDAGGGVGGGGGCGGWRRRRTGGCRNRPAGDGMAEALGVVSAGGAAQFIKGFK